MASNKIPLTDLLENNSLHRIVAAQEPLQVLEIICTDTAKNNKMHTYRNRNKIIQMDREDIVATVPTNAVVVENIIMKSPFDVLLPVSESIANVKEPGGVHGESNREKN